MARAKQPPATVKIPFATLRALLGRPTDDAEVMAVLAGAGKVKSTSDAVIAKDAGFDFTLVAGAKRAAKKRLGSIVLYPEGVDGHRGFIDLPEGVTFGPRADLLANLPSPVATYKDGTGDVPASTADDEVSMDTFLLSGFELRASYREGFVHHLTVSPRASRASSPALGIDAHTLAVFPLDALPRPDDAEPDAELTPMAVLVAWAADRFGLPPKHADSELGRQLIAHEITPRSFLIGACSKSLTSLDFAPQLAEFLAIYTGHTPAPEAPSRAAANAKIKALLQLDADRHQYTDDYRGTFSSLESPYYVPDSWESVARMSPVIDARLADYESTKLKRAPRISLYAQAAEARDMWTVQAARTPK